MLIAKFKNINEEKVMVKQTITKACWSNLKNIKKDKKRLIIKIKSSGKINQWRVSSSILIWPCVAVKTVYLKSVNRANRDIKKLEPPNTFVFTQKLYHSND